MPILPGDDERGLDRGARELAAGGLVAFPTETVYGLGARADDDAAVRGIFAAKGRPEDHPLIVHVLDAGQAGTFAEPLSDTARRLMAALWPGPVTLVLPRRDGVARAAAGGLPTIGLRCPDHPVARALLRRAQALGVAGVAAPSANRFGRVSPTLAAHVADEFGPGLMVLDGGACREGIESAIVDCTSQPPRLLRPGTIDRARLEAVLGQALGERDAASPRVSGSLASHYAPRADVRLADAAAIVQGVAAAAARGDEAGATAVYARPGLELPPGTRHRAMPDNAGEVAHELFAVLRQFDAQGVARIWVQAPPDDPAWDGVRDRLQRAAATR